jgi:hypothetical protein
VVYAIMAAVGARIRRGCLLRHVSVELSEDGDWRDESWERNLVSVGYQGTRHSIWALQVRVQLLWSNLVLFLMHTLKHGVDYSDVIVC